MKFLTLTPSFAEHPMVKIDVADSQKPFFVHKKVICDESTFFYQYFNGPTKPGSIVLHHVSVETMRTYTLWLYDKGGLFVNEQIGTDDDFEIKEELQFDRYGEKADEKPAKRLWWADLDRANRVFGRLLDLYNFSTFYGSPDFTKDVMKAWQVFTTTRKSYPCATVIRRAITEMDNSAPLYKYLILCFVNYDIYHIPCDGELSKLPASFLADVLVSSMYKGMAG